MNKDPNWHLLNHSTSRKPTDPALQWVLGMLVLLVSAVTIVLVLAIPTNQVHAEQKEVYEAYFSKACSHLHYLSKELRTAEELYDLSAGTHIDPVSDDIHQSIAWDHMQLAREALQEAKAQHIQDIAWQASMGNPPPKEYTCL